MAVKPTPDGYQSVIPYLVVPDVAAEVEFLKQAFGASEMHLMKGPDGSVGHAEVRIGDSVVMMGRARGEWPPMPCMLYLYVEDVDATFARAIEAGGTSFMEPADQDYGDRSGAVKDASGNQWWIATHKEDVPPEEVARRQEVRQKPQV